MKKIKNKITFYLILCIIIGTRQNLGFKIFLSNSFQIHLYLKFITLKKGYPKNRLIVIPRSKSYISCQFPNYTIVDNRKNKNKEKEWEVAQLMWLRKLDKVDKMVIDSTHIVGLSSTTIEFLIIFLFF